MNQEEHSFSKNPIVMSFDDFEISAESFKPVTKGLGFHQEQKKNVFKPTSQPRIETFKNSGPINNISNELEVKIQQQSPSGLQAFYGASATTTIPQSKIELSELPTISEVLVEAKPLLQFTAWTIDLVLVLALVALTGGCLVVASGLNYALILKLVSRADLAIFGGSVFSIYYILYFTILDLSTTPGKTICGIRLVGSDRNPISVKNTFIRSIVSLLSVLVFCFPMVLDFQGRLSDTKIVK
jgi:uncharacterized RDD family membrane protein YckC